MLDEGDGVHSPRHQFGINLILSNFTNISTVDRRSLAFPVAMPEACVTATTVVGKSSTPKQDPLVNRRAKRWRGTATS